MYISYDERKKLTKEHNLTMNAMTVYEEIAATYTAGSPVPKRTITSIANETGLSRPTVKKLLTQLIECKIVDNRDGYYVPVAKEIPPSYPYNYYPEMYYGYDMLRIDPRLTYVTLPYTVGGFTATQLSNESVPKYRSNPLDKMGTSLLPSSTYNSTDLSTYKDTYSTYLDNYSTPNSTNIDLSTPSITVIINNSYVEYLLKYCETPLPSTHPVRSFLSFVALRYKGDMSPVNGSLQLKEDRRKHPTDEAKFNRLVGRHRKRAEELQRKIAEIKERQKKNSRPESPPVTNDLTHDIIRWETDGGRSEETSPIPPKQPLGASENVDMVSDPTPTPSVAYRGSQSVLGVSWHGVAPPPGYVWEDMFFSGQSKDRLERVVNLGPEHWEARANYKQMLIADQDYLRGVRDDSPLDTFIPHPYTSVGEMLRVEYDPVDVSDPDAQWRGKGTELMGRWKARRNIHITWDSFLEYMLMGDTPKPEEDDPQYHVWYTIFQRRKSVL